MGNWRTVNIDGHLDPSDVPAAREFINTGQDRGRFHCLCYYGPSLCGLGEWIPPEGGTIHAIGNLSERNYGVDDVAEALRGLVAVAPSLRLKVHCGADWESDMCVATVTVADGVVSVGPPERATIDGDMGDVIADRIGAYLNVKG